MFKTSILTILLAAVLIVHADPTPSEPGPNEVFNADSTCHIAWDPDTTGQWKTMNIELMTGPNRAMVHLTTVAHVDGTDPTNTTFDFTCPQVTPNSDIYFYQFTSPDSADTLWTTRFAIADANGNTTPPPQSTQPDGTAVPWGTGQLVDPSSAVPPPTKGSAAASNSTLPASSSGASASASSASASSSIPSSNLPASSPSGMSKASSSGSASSAAAQATGAVANGTTPNSAVGVSVDSKLSQVVVSLAAVAAVFAVAL